MMVEFRHSKQLDAIDPPSMWREADRLSVVADSGVRLTVVVASAGPAIPVG